MRRTCGLTGGFDDGLRTALDQVYRAAQKEIAALALEAVGQQAGRLLSAATSGSSTINSLQQRRPADASSNGSIGQSVQQDAASAGVHAAGMHEHSPSLLRECVLHNGSLSLELMQAVQAGQELACIPLQSGLAVASQADLAVALALAAIDRSAARRSAAGADDHADEKINSSSAIANKLLYQLLTLRHPLMQHALPGGSRDALLEGLAGDAPILVFTAFLFSAFSRFFRFC